MGAIRRVITPGAPLSPALSKRNFNPTLKRTVAKSEIPDAQHFTTQRFRGGATHVIRNSRSPDTVLAGSGGGFEGGPGARRSRPERVDRDFGPPTRPIAQIGL